MPMKPSAGRFRFKRRACFTFVACSLLAVAAIVVVKGLPKSELVRFQGYEPSTNGWLARFEIGQPAGDLSLFVDENQPEMGTNSSSLAVWGKFGATNVALHVPIEFAGKPVRFSVGYACGRDYGGFGNWLAYDLKLRGVFMKFVPEFWTFETPPAPIMTAAR